jgi:hypothetical protein
MGIRSRLEGLEGKIPCAACADKRPELRSYWPQEGEARPEAVRCKECGRDLRVLLRCVYEDRAARDYPREGGA